MVTYTSVPQAIASVPLYTAIITIIPGHSSKNVWVLDPTIPLSGWKFSLLISLCVLLFLFLLMLNAILLFTKLLMRFNVFQGPLKSQYYYWVGVQLIRNIIMLLSLLGKTISVTSGCLIILTTATILSCIQPNKEKLINFLELTLLYNYVVLCILLMFIQYERFSVIIVNVMVGPSFIQLLAYHMLMYMYPCMIFL